MKSVRLLVVDEYEGFYELIKDYASICQHQFDIEVEYAGSGEEARKKMASYLPSVILVDVHLPDVSSMSLIEQCKNEMAPIIATSSYPSENIKESALSRGAEAYLPKGENPEQLELLLYQIYRIADEIADIH